MPFEKIKITFPKLRQNEPLKSHSTFRVGGPADFFYEATTPEEIVELVKTAEAEKIPYKIIGRGTNILFTDKGFRGLIIKNITNKISVDGRLITAESGVLLIQIIKASVEHNLTGLEPLYGLPGSIGAAVWGDAGVPKTETGSFVKKLTLFNPKDGVREVDASFVKFSYRHTSLQNSPEIVLSVTLELKEGSKETSKELMKQIDEIRRGKQPTGYSAGSFFKNPLPDKAAGYLIDQVGLKGFSMGDAHISEKHANFFMNRGKATAAQILELAALAKQKVKEKFGIDLEMEVKVVGDL